MATDNLAGKVALITGAGQGVGAAIASELSLLGATVAINDLRRDRADATVDRIIDAGGHAIPAVGDVGDHQRIKTLVADITRLAGPVDILINNAGIPAGGIELKTFADSGPDDWDPLLRVNVLGVMNCTHAVTPTMVKRGWGRIITISSDSGRTGEAMMAVYAASKAAGAGLTRSLAKELGPHGITCNTLSLGTITTEETDRDHGEQMGRQLRRYPVKRFGKATDVAAAVLWLVSEGAGWTTGQTIPINGGFATS